MATERIDLILLRFTGNSVSRVCLYFSPSWPASTQTSLSYSGCVTYKGQTRQEWRLMKTNSIWNGTKCANKHINTNKVISDKGVKMAQIYQWKNRTV